jgi:hypothetical protein
VKQTSVSVSGLADQVALRPAVPVGASMVKRRRKLCTYDRGTSVPRTGYGKPSRPRAGWAYKNAVVAGRNVSVPPGRTDDQAAGRAVRPWSVRRRGKAEVLEDGPSCFSFGQHCQDAERAAAGVAYKHVHHEDGFHQRRPVEPPGLCWLTQRPWHDAT